MKIFCGNLRYEVTADDLLELFARYLPWDCHVMLNADGRPSGAAFVHIDRDKVNQFIAEFDGKEFQGRRMHVKIALNQNKRVDRREKALSRNAQEREQR